jgi:DNA helicase-2/ATP-dependent DNA helicase PcrA
LKAIYNPADDIAVKRIINIPKRGIGDTTIDKVIKQAAATESNFFDVLTYSDEIPDLQRSAKKLKEFSKMLITLQVRVETMSVVDLIEEVLNITGYVTALELENTEEARGRIDNIKELISKAADYKKRVDDPSLTGFLEEVSLVADIDNYQENANSVVLMTLHSAKGLEFPYVFMTGLEEGIFPSYRSMTSGEEKDVEEERRLCYVGITRAREMLYITHTQSRMLRGMTQYNSPSRFIREIPEHFVEETQKPVVEKPVPKANATGRKALPAQVRKFVQNANTFTMPTPKNVILDFGQGDVVQHKKFGEGTVQAIQPAGADYEVTVFFPQYGAKKLMAQFSNLKSI